MSKQPWEVPDPPTDGDETNDITFRAVGAALSQWEWFEGNLSIAFSYLIGTPGLNVAAMRAYGSVETFRGRANMIEKAAEVYFRYHVIDPQSQQALEKLIVHSRDRLSARRNEIAHGIVQPLGVSAAGVRDVKEGFALFPAYYATRKRRLSEDGSNPTQVEPTYVYSSKEIDAFGTQFANLANDAINLLGHLVTHSRRKTST